MKPLMTALLTTVAMTTASTGLAAESYPAQPIRLIVPFGAGGGTDGLARAIQLFANNNNLLPEPIVVVNAPGAGGAVGTRQLLASDPNGYTILQIHQEMFAASAIERVNYTPEDFEPIIQVSEACMFVAVNEDSPYTNLDEMFSDINENPGDFRQADDIGGATHFPSAQLMNAAGVQWPIVPAGATSARFTSLQGGFTQMALLSPLWLERAAGKIRPLAVLGDERYDFAPDLPTAKEQGYDVTACLNRRYWAPSGTPQAHVDILADTIEAAANSEEVQAYLAESGEVLKIVRGEELRDLIDNEYASFVEVADAVKGSLSN
ncbi:tripartite tricarboxylate transporter substrate binding protein [Halomonas sp. AOP5-B2-8]